MNLAGQARIFTLDRGDRFSAMRWSSIKASLQSCIHICHVVFIWQVPQCYVALRVLLVYRRVRCIDLRTILAKPGDSDFHKLG